MNGGLFADRGIDHGVVNNTVRPFDMEILLDEIGAFPINGIHELFGILLALAASQQAPHFIFSRSVKKHTQRILAALEKLLRPPSDDDGVSRFRRVLDDTFCNLQNTFAVDQLELGRIEAAFITSAHERFEEPVIQGIRSFLSNLDDCHGTFSKPRDLLRQQLIPKLPAKLLRQQLSDFAAAASVLAFNGDDSYHHVEIPEI
ncbi:MAG: hypothetical protein ABSF85_13055 [Terriglobales bacterium]